MMGIKAIETEKPVLPLILTNKIDGLLRTPGGLVKFCRRSFLYIRTYFFSLKIMLILSMFLQPLGVCIFLPVWLGMVRPRKIIIPIIRAHFHFSIRAGSEV